MLLVDVTFPNCLHELAETAGHLTPCSLREEMLTVIADGTTPACIVAVHISPQYQEELALELDEVSGDIGIKIDLGFEGMVASV